MAPSPHAKAIYLRYLLSFIVSLLQTDQKQEAPLSCAHAFHWDCVTAITTSEADFTGRSLPSCPDSSPARRAASSGDALPAGRDAAAAQPQAASPGRGAPVHASRRDFHLDKKKNNLEPELSLGCRGRSLREQRDSLPPTPTLPARLSPPPTGGFHSFTSSPRCPCPPRAPDENPLLLLLGGWG